MKEKFFVLEVDIKTMFAVIGCLNMIIISKNLKIEVHFSLGDQILQLCIQKEDWYLLLVEMMPKVFIQRAKNMTFKMTHGVELQIWTLRETQQLLAYSTTNTYMFFQEGLSLIRKKLLTQLKCMILITTCGEWWT